VASETPGAGNRPPGGRGDRGRERGGGGGRGRGRDGRGGKDRGRGRDRDDGGGSTYRVGAELPHLEKALSSGDFAKQREPLEAILKALKPLRLTSFEQIDMNTRGRLLTTLLRVQRQNKPAPAEAPAAAASEAPPAEVAAAPQDPAQATPAPEASPADGASAPAETAAPEATPEAAGAAAPADASAPAAATPPVDERANAYQDVMFLVGSVWRAAGDERRAALAFAQSGRRADQREAVKTLEKSGDWQEQAKVLAEQGRTRDAARTHERNQSFAEAGKLFEAGGDARSALRAFLSAEDMDGAKRVLAGMKVEEAKPILEKAKAWELLMGRHIEAGDFGEVARLYERARQFDQAALAWERAGKLASARKAYERAKDPGGADRIRTAEVADLLKRGDRLGAATLLISGGKRQEALDTVMSLPPPKAFHFLQRLKLDEEALALGRREVEKAEKENRPSAKARWLEQLGEPVQAGEAWEAAARRDKALPLYEQAGQWARAAALAEVLGQHDKAIELFHRAGDRQAAERVAALPKPPPAAPAPPPAEDSDDSAPGGSPGDAPPAQEPAEQRNQ
jgi:tetratricopeptide (TPR) repeat protein